MSDSSRLSFGRVLTALATLSLICACSSDSKKSSSKNSSDDSSASVNEAPSSSSKSSSASEPETAARAAKASQDAVSSLQEAIKSQNDDAIQRTAMAVLMQNANDVRALNAMGLFHYRKGRPLAAQLFFSKAQQLSPNSSEIYSNMGLVYLALKEEIEATRSFKKAIELNPSDLNAAGNLGSIYVDHRDFNKAFAILSMNTGRSHDLKFLNNFAIACAETGKVEQAESLYQEALKVAPSNKEVLFNYATLQIEYLNKYKEGLETLGRLKLFGPVEGMKNQTNELENKAKAGLK